MSKHHSAILVVITSISISSKGDSFQGDQFSGKHVDLWELTGKHLVGENCLLINFVLGAIALFRSIAVA